MVATKTRKPATNRVPRRRGCLIDLVDDAQLIAGEWDARLVAAAVDAALAADGMHGGQLVVRLVDAGESRRLHRTHFRQASATDVMTFPDGTDDPETGRLRLGDLAICLDIARLEAARRNRPTAHELALYVVHGVLHLLGHDDVDPRDRAAMWAEQHRVLAEVGIAVEAEPAQEPPKKSKAQKKSR